MNSRMKLIICFGIVAWVIWILLSVDAIRSQDWALLEIYAGILVVSGLCVWVVNRYGP